MYVSLQEHNERRFMVKIALNFFYQIPSNGTSLIRRRKKGLKSLFSQLATKERQDTKSRLQQIYLRWTFPHHLQTRTSHPSRSLSPFTFFLHFIELLIKMNRFTVIDLLFMDMSLLVGILLTRTSTRNDSTHMKLICEHNFPYPALFLSFLYAT